MADLTRSAVDVRMADHHVDHNRQKRAAVALQAGQPVYIKNDGTIDKAAAGAAGTAIVWGVTATKVAAGEMVACWQLAVLTGFSGLTPGARVYLSNTAGEFADAAGTVTTVVGIALTPSMIQIRCPAGL